PALTNFSFTPVHQLFITLSANAVANFVGTQSVVSISGTITDSNNAPLNNVPVLLTKNGAPAGTAQTNPAGSYSFGGLSAGDTYIVTPTGSFTPSSQTFGSLTTNGTGNFRGTPIIAPQCNTPNFVTGNFPTASTP